MEQNINSLYFLKTPFVNQFAVFMDVTWDLHIVIRSNRIPTLKSSFSIVLEVS